MRISQLDIRACGPFTDRILTFDTARPGLHVIFGPNEAGKSSALRALKAWLFGFPEQTADDFRHAYKDLLVGGTLRMEDGREWRFFRRKRRKADLIDDSENPLSPDILDPFLPVRDRLIFESLYGIDHSSLIRGGEDILAQKGEIGQTLFSAGAGIASLRQITEMLESDAGALFKRQGKRQKINESIARYKAIQRQIKDASLAGSEWKSLQQDLQEAAESLNSLDTVLAEKEKERRRLERIRQALPQLMQRRDIRNRITALGQVVALPPDFSEQRSSVQASLGQLKRDQIGTRHRLAEIDQKMATLQIKHPLLEQATTISHLRGQLGAHEKAMQDRPKREGMRSSCLSDALKYLKNINANLDLSRSEDLRPLFGKRRLIQSLANRHGEIQLRLQQNRKRTSALAAEQRTTRQMLKDLPQTLRLEELSRVTRQGRKMGDLDQIIRSKATELVESRSNCHQEIKNLGCWTGVPDALLSLPLPLRETITDFEERCGQLEAERNDLNRQIRELTSRREENSTNLATLQNTGVLPSEEELAAIRRRREHGWSLLKRQWIEGADIAEAVSLYSDGLPLHDAYENDVREADTTADRLRREADRVQRFAALQAENNTLQERLLAAENEAERLQNEQTALTAEWRSSWQEAGIEPLSPREMQAWLNRCTPLLSELSDIQKQERELEDLRQQRQTQCNRLIETLNQAGEKAIDDSGILSPLLDRAEQILEEQGRVEQHRLQMSERLLKTDNELKPLQEEIEQLEDELADWREQWRELMTPLKSTQTVQPAEAADLIENLQACFEKLEKADDFQKRIDGIDADAGAFSKSVTDLASLVAPDIEPLPPSQIVARLESDLRQSSENQNLKQALAEERQDLAATLKANAAEIETLENKLSEQCRLAGVTSISELAAVEERSRQYRQLQEDLATIEQVLLAGAEGLTIEELEEQAKAVDHDQLSEAIASLDREIQNDLNPRIRELSERIGQKRTEINRLDGNAVAADALEESRHELALMSRLVNQYVRLKLATRILNDEIERFRAENQDPVLKIASRYFAGLTLGSFSGLRTDEDEHGKPILVGFREDNARLQVSEMSSGTRDQLYLALRFASLEWKHRSSEPMPFILDDILVNFDDDRSRAALQAMAELSAATQVILFTHHRQIVTEARQMAETPDLKIHELPSGH